jgi:hypothetical protein
MMIYLKEMMPRGRRRRGRLHRILSMRSRTLPASSHTVSCTGSAKLCTHCNENPIYVYPEKELRGLSPNFPSHVSVSDLYKPRIGPHIFLQQNRQTDRGNTVYKSLTDT